MLPLTEDLAKDWLREHGLPVPRGAAAASPAEAARIAGDMPDGAVVKALIPIGRRGKAGAVHLAANPDECRAAAAGLLGTSVNGHAVRRVYVEERIAIRDEHYLSLSLRGPQPEILITRGGGIDIEEVMRNRPERLVRAAIDPLRGLPAGNATKLLQRAGFDAALCPRLAELTVALYDAFCAADALLLEINPLAVTGSGSLMLVGAMMGVDEHALFRHAAWADVAAAVTPSRNPREHSVAVANREFPGGECQYVELAGDIGLLVGGGGAGLYQHDIMLELGGRPANHCVTPPTGTDNRKLKAVLAAILDNPQLKGLLVGFNFAQMARTDIRVSTLMELLEEKRIDTARLPVVIRLFGAGEQASRAMVAGYPNIHYVSRGTTLKEAVRLIVELTARASTKAVA